MSLLKSIGKVFTGAVKTIGGGILGTAIGGPLGGVVGAAISQSGSKLATKGLAGAAGALGAVKALPAIVTKPGVGAVVGTVAGAGASMLYDALGNPVKKKRRRRKGITPKDLTSFKRVARLIDKFAAPVHKLRKKSYQPACH